MRKPHDLIVNTLNTVVPTDSFHTDEVAACKGVYENIENGNVKRENFIKNCITVTADRVKKLKEERASKSDDIQLSKQLRAEQTKVSNHKTF